jgi:hypothetical protein
MQHITPAQDEINHRHPGNSPIHMMCWMNFWCALYYGAYLAGEGRRPAPTRACDHVQLGAKFVLPCGRAECHAPLCAAAPELQLGTKSATAPAVSNP